MAQLDTTDLLTPTGEGLGAIVRGIDLREPARAETILALKRGLLEHHVLIFQGQDLSEPEYLAFARYFGSVFSPPKDVPVLASDPYGVTPDIVLVANVEGGHTGTGELTPHADHHWTPLPSAGSFLYALEVPGRGGDTIFYNLARAYETLDAATQQRIEGLKLITYNPFIRPKDEPRSTYRLEPKPLVAPVYPHPLVRTHPDSGRKILFLGAQTEVEVVGLSPREGSELIAELRAHLLQERFTYRHRWRAGDITYWDNQAVLHARDAFAPTERRVLKRISLAGSRPF